MSTRAHIAMKTGENECRAIYTHFDGYIKHHAPILLEHYAMRERVEALLALGDLSVLAGELGEKQDFDDRSTHRDNWCLAYGRDRNDEDTEARVMRIDNLIKNGIQYAYLFDPETETWSVTRRGRVFHPLADWETMTLI